MVLSNDGEVVTTEGHLKKPCSLKKSFKMINYKLFGQYSSEFQSKMTKSKTNRNRQFVSTLQ